MLIDAFIVRALLVSSLMALRGRLELVVTKPLARLHTRLGAIAYGAGSGLSLPDAAGRWCAEGSERR